ncbi:MAG: hypothetical protein PVF32_26385, partial [Desulfobacterales bacterium]
IITIFLVVSMYFLNKPIVSRILKSNFIQFAAGLFYPSSPKFSKPTGNPVKISIDRKTKVSEIDEKFLSFSVDSSQVVGGHWWSRTAEVEGGLGRSRTKPFDFSRPRLHMLAKALAPAYLRIGGSEADVLYYEMTDKSMQAPPPPYELVFTRQMWDEIQSFAQSVGYSIFFTINAGPATRDGDKNWTTENAARLLEYTRQRNYRVEVWELGNEINVYWFQFGNKNRISASQYANDFMKFKKLIKSYDPDALVGGPSSFFWPLMGEPLAFRYGIIQEFMKTAGAWTDIVTWHYYPQQSRRCGFAVRPAKPNLLLNPSYLDEVQKWAALVENGRDEFAPQAQVWFGEVGNAQCGGEPGVSDTYVGGLWWLDLLGMMARRGQQVIVRQTLCDSHYALIDDMTLEPNPDYWNSLIWKRLMGTRVLSVTTSKDNAYVRAYAHCTINKKDSVTLLLLNVNETQKAKVLLDDIKNPQEVMLYELSAPHLVSKKLHLNGELIELKGGKLPAMTGKPVTLTPDHAITLAPATYMFIELPDTAVPD